MALNDIQLDSSLLKAMYRNSLVELGEAPVKPERSLPTPGDSKTDSWKWLGNNKKGILLVVCFDTTSFLPDEQLKFLTSVLGACKLGLDDVAVLNLEHAPQKNFNAVQEKFKSSSTILFGVTPREFEMPIDFPEFQVQPFNKCTFLHTPDLGRLEADKVLKSKLWVSLRRVFNLP